MKKELMLILVLLLLAGCSSGITGGFREPLAPCRDTDGGANYRQFGRAIDYYYTRTDYCYDDFVLFEAVCANFQQSAFVIHECENGCLYGVCKNKI